MSVYQDLHIDPVIDRNVRAFIHLSLSPSFCVIMIDNKDPVPVDKEMGFSLEPGKYKITVAKEGYIPYTFHVTLGEGELYTEEIILYKEEIDEEKFLEKKPRLKKWT